MNNILAQDTIEIKRKMLSNYQLKIVGFYNIPIGAAKKLLSNFFEKEKYLLKYENLQM